MVRCYFLRKYIFLYFCSNRNITSFKYNKLRFLKVFFKLVKHGTQTTHTALKSNEMNDINALL